MILMITRAGETHADAVEKEILSRNLPYERYHLADFPTQAGLSIRPKNHQYAHLNLPGKETISFQEVQSVWYYRPEPPQPNEAVNPDYYLITLQETQEAIRDFHTSLWDCFWMNAPSRKHIAANKLSQLQIAARLGLKTPDTLVSNSPDGILAFLEQHGGQAVYKPIYAFRQLTNADVFYNAFASIVTTEDVAQNPDSLAVMPNLFQAVVPKSAEFTVFVIGQHVFCIQIIPLADIGPADVDWRLVRDRFEVAQLPSTLTEKCVAMTQALGLNMCNFDFAQTPDGDFVFLDANPTEQWLNIEAATGLPMTQTVVDVLQTSRVTATFKGVST